FKNTANFNQDLSSWDVSHISSFQEMFENAVAFNGKLDNWKPGSQHPDGASLKNKCEGRKSCNQDLSSWDESYVSSFQEMFENAVAFNGKLDNWKPGSQHPDGASLNNMFKGTQSFNQDLSSWDVSYVSSFQEMFENAVAFNGKLDNWKPGSQHPDGASL